MVDYSHMLCATIALAYLADKDTILDQRFCGWAGVYVSPFLVYLVPSTTKYDSM